MQEVYSKLLSKRSLPCRTAARLLPLLSFALLFFALEIALMGIPSAWANSIPVTNTNDSGAGSLRQALINAQANDTIVFNLPPNSTIHVSRALTVTRPITVDGSTAINLQVSGNRSTRVFEITANALLRGFWVVEGAATGNGGGVQSTMPLTLIKMRFDNNRATGSGGGVYAGVSLTMTNTNFYSNTAANSGGAVRVIGAADIQNSEFLQNKASTGAGLSANDRTGITNTIFLLNGGSTTTNGGGFYHDFDNVSVTIVNSLFADNFAQTGAALNFTANANANLSHLTIARSFGAGSAVAVSGGTVGIGNSIIVSNSVGLALTGGSLFSTYNLFAGNTTDKSGAISGGLNEVSGDPAFANPAMHDYRLRMTSAARDKGTNAGFARDFEGQARTFGTAPDIGFDEVPIETNSRCYATRDDLIVFGSVDGKALQWAVNVAFFNDTIKVAGACVGMPGSVMANFGGVSMGIRGGYTVTNWMTSNPVANPTILDAQHGGQVLYNIGPSKLTVENLTIQNGKHCCTGGGGIYGWDLVLTNVNVFNSTAIGAWGGGVLADSTARIQGGLFQNNHADYGGGLYTRETLILTGTQFISNTASEVFGGGGVLVEGPAQITDALFRKNSSVSSGGGGLQAEDTLTLIGSIFEENTAKYGAGAYVDASAQVRGGRFQNNNGGALSVAGALTLTGTQFLSNTTTGYGGGVDVRGAAQVNGGLFQNNSSSSLGGGGGGMYVGSTLVMTGTSFLNNSGRGLYVSGIAQIADALFESNKGGGLFASKALRLNNSQFINNRGGGVYAADAAQVNNGLFQSNVVTDANSGGGGLYVGITLTMTATQFISNVASAGGGALVDGPAQVIGGLFQNNSAVSGGGLRVNKSLWLSGTHFIANMGGGATISQAAHIQGALFQNNTKDGGLQAFDTLTITGSQFIGNSKDGLGGGAASNGAMQVDGTLFQNNQCTSDFCYGGGLYATKAVTVTNSHFLGNRAKNGGGGLYHNTGTATVVNSLFARNVANSGDGAALFFDASKTARILHTTVASPTVASGSAIYGTSNATVGISNTIVSSHTTGIRINGGAAYENYNLFFGNNENTFGFQINGGANDLTGNPAFVNPASDDYHLTASSAALDRATNVGVTRDFEGQPRPQGLGNDIGYDESPFAATVSGLHASNSSPTALSRATIFTATATGNNLHYTWNFGDGAPTATGASTVHTYTVVGNYTAVVTVTNGISTQVASTAVSITDASIRNLVASNNSPTVLGSVTTLSATATGGSIVYTWNFGDGTPTATGATIPHTYAAVGNYTAVVTATNGISTVVASTPVSIVGALTAKLSVTVEREGSGAVLPGTVVTYQVAITNTGGVTVQITNIRGGVPTVEQSLDSAGVTQVDAACAAPINLAPAAVHRCSLTWVAAGNGGQQVNFVVTVDSSAANGQTSSVSTQNPVLIASPTTAGGQRLYLPVVLK